jgi:hypothetical protein
MKGRDAADLIRMADETTVAILSERWDDAKYLAERYRTRRVELSTANQTEVAP